jgi:hypothetical protein
VKDQFAGRRGGVDVLVQADQLDPALFKRRDELDQLLHRTRQPVEPPHDDAVAAADLLEHAVEPGPFDRRTRTRVAIDPLATRRSQLRRLQVQILIRRGNSRVADLHKTSAKTRRWPPFVTLILSTAFAA